MSKSEKMLLKSAYDNYLKTSELEYKFLPTNGDMLLSALSGAESLQNAGYIEVYSDNLYKDTLYLVKDTTILDDIVIWFRLTYSGLTFARENFN